MWYESMNYDSAERTTEAYVLILCFEAPQFPEYGIVQQSSIWRRHSNLSGSDNVSRAPDGVLQGSDEEGLCSGMAWHNILLPHLTPSIQCSCATI